MAHQLLRPGERLLLGVSGGPDSVTLLHLFLQMAAELRLRLGVVHVNHGLRSDAAEDAAFVKQLADRWGVPALVLSRDVPALVEAEGRSIEDAARRLRYDAFEEAVARWSAHRLALAHTADDQAETVLMRLLRGAGLTGLSAIPLSRPLGQAMVIRPLLGVWREEVLAYAARHRLPHRDDPTNRDLKFLRNRIRRELLPLLAQTYNPNIKALLVQLAEQARDDLSYLQETVRRSWSRFAKSVDGAVLIRTSALLKQPQAARRAVIRMALSRLQGGVTGFEFRHWREIEQLMLDRPVGSVVDLPGRIRLERRRDGLLMRAAGRPIRSTSFQDGEFAVY